jgi:hypothetical protein
MSFIEITDPMPEPTPPEKCPVGPAGHKWVLEFDTGPSLHLADGETCPSLYPDRPEIKETVCEDTVLGYAGFDVVQMEPIPVRVAFETDHPNLGGWHGDVRCDCNWWWQITLDDARDRDAEKVEG